MGQASTTECGCLPAGVAFLVEIVLSGGERFYGLDRGGMVVVRPDGTPWLDLLLAVPPDT